MSGIEVISLLLPLLVSTAGGFRELCQSIKRYRGFEREARWFQVKLSTQRVLFHSECRILLERIAGKEKASSWLETPRRMLEDLNLGIQSFQGSAVADEDNEVLKAILENLDLIETKLKNIECTAMTFREAAAEGSDHQGQKLGSKPWRHRVGSKIDFSLSERQLVQSLDELRSLIHDFKALAMKVGQKEPLSDPPSSFTPMSSEKAIKNVKMVQKASRYLYEAFSTACTKHAEHRASFPLQVDVIGPEARQFRFTLAFKHQAQGSLDQAERPTWIAVESIMSDISSAGPTEVAHAASKTPKIAQTRERSPSSPGNGKRRKINRVTFVLPTRPASSTRAMLPSQIGLMDLCRNQNFCNQIMNCCSQAGPHGKDCIGYMSMTPGCQHFVYLTDPTLPYQRQQSTSLASLFAAVSKRNRSGGLVQYERIRLATLLAKAVLLFYNTPWVGGVLRSQDIFFYGVNIPRNPLLEIPKLNTPYVNALVNPSRPQISGRTFSAVKNSPTLSLGVVLLELAFQDSLENLQQPCDVEGRYTLSNTAQRLVSSVGRELGGSYGEVVKKCLRGPSHLGYELEDLTVQKEFHRDVISELEKLEEGLRRFQLAD